MAVYSLFSQTGGGSLTTDSSSVTLGMEFSLPDAYASTTPTLVWILG